VVCGSPGEVANDPFLDGVFDSFTQYSRTTKIVDFGQQKKNIWLLSALGMHGLGGDQLRQKMAWALSQILVVSSDAIQLGNSRTEFFMVYYDIFVSHTLLPMEISMGVSCFDAVSSSHPFILLLRLSLIRSAMPLAIILTFSRRYRTVH
jgi:hypothetical protein